MATRAEYEARIRAAVYRQYSYVDALFEDVLETLKGNRSVLADFEKKLLAVEELRRSIALETLVYIARFQPLGHDLVRAEEYIRVSYSLFRVSRYLLEIERLDSIAGPLREAGINIEVVEKARAMVRDAVKAFLDRDTRLAMHVKNADEEIDKYYKEALEKLKSDTIPRKVALEALYARHVERLADHAKYIAMLAFETLPE